MMKGLLTAPSTPGSPAELDAHPSPQAPNLLKAGSERIVRNPRLRVPGVGLIIIHHPSYHVGIFQDSQDIKAQEEAAATKAPIFVPHPPLKFKQKQTMLELWFGGFGGSGYGVGFRATQCAGHIFRGASCQAIPIPISLSISTLHIYICICICGCVYIHIHISICISLSLHLYIFISIYICICICTYNYIYIILYPRSISVCIYQYV